jgi:hypothetical protein
MSRGFRQFCFVAGFVAVMGTLSWLLIGESSPFYRFFIYHVSLPNLWRMIHIPALILSIIGSGNVHQGSEAGFIIGFVIQWSLVGFVLSPLVRRRFHRDDDHAYQSASANRSQPVGPEQNQMPPPASSGG